MVLLHNSNYQLIADHLINCNLELHNVTDHHDGSLVAGMFYKKGIEVIYSRDNIYYGCVVYIISVYSFYNYYACDLLINK